jgi:transmembrane sensor
MVARSNYREIDQQAAEWAARRDAGSLTTSEQTEFEIWLSVDTRHVGAYAKAEAVLCQLERAGPAGAVSLRQCPAPESLTRRGLILTGSIAASLGVVLPGSYFAWRYLHQQSYATQIGETRVVPLGDGSVITLNTNSRVTVNYTKSIREIHLLEGEALFDVAKNKRRPFVVVAGDTQVRAVGTSFTVKFLPDRPLLVLVQEGTVELKRPDIPQAPPVRVSVNSKAVAPDDAPIKSEQVEPVEISRALAWRVGRISFDNETLKAAAAEFARYSSIEIEVDPVVADETITGLFVSNDPVGFARAAATSLNLRADVGSDEVRITR